MADSRELKWFSSFSEAFLKFIRGFETRTTGRESTRPNVPKRMQYLQKPPSVVSEYTKLLYMFNQLCWKCLIVPLMERSGDSY